MKADKIVFLDIDGVVNSRKWYYARSCMPKEMFIPTDDRVTERDMRELDLTVLGLLCKLVLDTGSKIVITSTWRLGKDPLYFRLMFHRRGITEFPRDTFIGCTPSLPSSRDTQGHNVTRGTEIQKWIEDNNFTGKYVIFDDDSDFLLTQKPNFIQTSHEDGLNWDHYYRALCILGQTTPCDDCSVGWIIPNDGDYKTYVRDSNRELFNSDKLHKTEIYKNCPSCGREINFKL